MAGSVNKAIIVGNLGADPEVRRTQTGRPVVSFSVATSQSWRDKATGERKEHTDWHRVVIFAEGLCKVAEDYLKKGSKVYLEGEIKTRKWVKEVGREKVDMYSTEIVLQGFQASLTLLDRAQRAPSAEPGAYGQGDTRDYGAPSGGQPGEAQPGASAGKPDDMNDEIPF